MAKASFSFAFLFSSRYAGAALQNGHSKLGVRCGHKRTLDENAAKCSSQRGIRRSNPARAQLLMVVVLLLTLRWGVTSRATPQATATVANNA